MSTTMPPQPSAMQPIAYHPTPTIYESLPGGIVRAWDIASKLLEDERTIFLRGVFDDAMAQSIVQQLMYLKSKDSKRDITIYINSPGGQVTSGLAIYDAMQAMPCDVSTVVMGIAASMGSFILMAGAKGKRFAMPNAEVMTHQPSGGYQGQATDIGIAAEHILRTKKRMTELYVRHCGGTLEDWAEMMERDRFHSAEEALKWGLVDQIVAAK